MKTKLYLHIGMNKTGSSAIQRFLSMNRVRLAEKGLLYPLTGCVGGAHYDFSTMLGFSQGQHKDVDLNSRPLLELLGALEAEVASVLPKVVVISSETFVLPRTVDIVRSFFRDYEIKVVVYLRRHDKWWPSAYNQAVRMVPNPPWGPCFESYIEFFHTKRPDVGDYRLLLDSWAEMFGKENVIVRPYEVQQNEPGLVVDFLRAIGKEELLAGLDFGNHRVNDSVDMNTLSLIDALQRSRIEPEIRRSLINHALANKKVSEALSVIEPELLLKLAKKHQDDYAYIAREYLGRDDGRLFYDPMPDPSLPWEKIGPPTSDQVIEFVVQSLGQSPNKNVVGRHMRTVLEK